MTNLVYKQRAYMVENNNDDLFVVNSARASFARWQDGFDTEKDGRLINYLASHKHISPFFQVRYAFVVSPDSFDIQKYLSHETYSMGAVIYYNKTSDLYLIKHSLYGWLRFLNDGIVNAHNILFYLIQKSPVSTNALMEHIFSFNPEKLSKTNDVRFVTNDLSLSEMLTNDPYNIGRFVDYSAIFEVPIFVARQIYTHRRLVKNERSGRYVSEGIKYYFPDCWREKPTGSVKQGSGECIQFEAFDEHGYYNPIDFLYNFGVNTCDDTYNKMINEYNVAPEMARMILPQSMMTRFVLTGNYDAWSAMFEERSTDGTQKETKQIVSDVYAQISKDFEKYA